MKIISIIKKSIASRRGISLGDELLAINGHPINDLIDYKYYSAEDHLDLKLKSEDGTMRRVKIKKQPDKDLGLEFDDIKYKSCKNNCIFCFVHQLPKGLRKALYFKDEDFRLSFLHGSFITLTNTSDEDIQRIIHQRLSPIYISAHTTSESLRKTMLGNQRIPDIMPKIRKLAQAKIEMHTQIVLCPGVNDGEYLDKSVQELSSLYPYAKSLALVPVGLTKFRSKLPKIRPVNQANSKDIIGMVDEWQKHCRKKWDSGFVYAADEFFTKAQLDIPEKGYYDEFYQIENGVGMMRQFMDTFRYKQRLLHKRLNKKLRITLVTGVSAFRMIKDIIDNELSSISGLSVRPVSVKNDFFGHSVTVTGLLAGKDIMKALRKEKNLSEIILLPPNCVNVNGLFLDDLAPRDLERKLERKVLIGSYDLVRDLIEISKIPFTTLPS
jgi:putative radical SAM enzyme (TIGR03279 family)